MKIILNKFTALDYPGETAAIVFFYGCNLRCPYCYNLDCYFGRVTERTITDYKLYDFLESRKGKLSGVVFSGGEPLLSVANMELIRQIKRLGFKTKLYTNGTRPDRLAELVPYLDSVDMSIKSIPEKYPLIGGTAEAIRESVKIIKNNFTDYHFNCVIFPLLCLEQETIDGVIDLVGDFASIQNKITFSAPKLDTPVLMEYLKYPGLPWGKDYKACIEKKTKKNNITH